MTTRPGRSSDSALLTVLTLAMTFFCPEPVLAQGTSDVPDGLSHSDWSSIRAAYEAGRHRAFAVDGGYRARNPAQRWSTRFDGRGFTVEPDGGGWWWGLELARYGFAGSERDIGEPVRTSADCQRVAYDWDAALTEWYINDARGLEHGFTLRERPAQSAAGPLLVALTVRGGLEPRVHSDGRGVCFANRDGASVLTYAGLIVRDADGRELPARIERAGAGLRICVEESAARYPLTIDPVAQQAYLKASNAEGAHSTMSDFFGYSVSVSGDTVVVGAAGEDSIATGFNGDQGNDSAVDSGAAYVFVRSGTGWSQQAYLKASNTGANDNFGWSVSVSGDTVVVGARLEDSNGTGVNGNELDNSASNAGAAYVFVRSGTAWSQQAYLKASNTGVGDVFGESVSVSGDTVVVGAESEDSNATGVNGDQSNNSANSAGAAYVFVRSGTAWSQQAYLKASNPGASDLFGYSVSVSGDTVVVGAMQEDSNATGVNGDQGNNSASSAGAAYVFARSGTAWSQQAYLKASNTGANDLFGRSVSVSGDTVVVGADSESSNATGVNGDQSNNSASSAGAAYVFARSGSTWSQQAYLKASNTGVADAFGYSVSVSGDTAVVGAQFEDSNGTGVNGNELDNSASNAGAAYVFVRSGTAWSQQAYLKASNTGASDSFGWSVSVSGDTVVVGAYVEDSTACGDESATDSGAAYAFSRSGTTWGQQAFLKTLATGSLADRFGQAVALSAETVVVGAPRESSRAMGVNGDQSDDCASAAGAAYVFVRSGSAWSQQAYLKASNTGANDNFGSSVSVSGDTVVVGADQEDSNATGVNGSELDNSASGAGAAYVFVRNGSTWSQQAYLKASNSGASDNFGYSVSVSGDTVVVGAASESSNATGVNGNELDNSASNAGAAYVFVRNGTTWSQQAYLKASNTGVSDYFGWSVSVSGDTVEVGAPLEDSTATGVNGDQANNNAGEAGAAYVFVRNGTTWSQQAYLKASNTGSGDNFGWSVSVFGNTVVVGARGEDSDATGVNGDQSNNNAGGAGAAYVFVRNGTAWGQQAYLKASNTGSSDNFGWSVSASGDTVVVAAHQEASNATGVNGDQSNNDALFAGAAYVFVPIGTTWSQQAYLKASNTGASDNFGYSVSVSGYTVVVGAYQEDSNATGVNGNASNNLASDSGAAYVFDISDLVRVESFGCSTPATGYGPPTLAVTSGAPRIGTTFDLTVQNASPNALASSLGFELFPAPAVSPQSSITLFGFCWNLPLTFAATFVPVPNSVTLPLTLPNIPAMVGTSIDWQVLAIDPTSTSTDLPITASRGLTTRIGM